MKISVEKIDENSFKVKVNSNSNTEHLVILNNEYWEKIGGRRSKEELIRKSFEFLLKRESNSSILSEFNLEEINEYFPEFEDIISD